MTLELSHWLLLAVLAAVSIPTLLLAAQVLIAVLPLRRVQSPQVAVPALAVLVPAHNESSGIGPTLASVQRALRASDRLIVVADNCTDDTAAVARAAGAEVLERQDPAHRGKGYALDFGVRHLAQQPPPVVVIVDADCVVAEGSIERIASLSAHTGRPVQALYLMQSPAAASPMQRIKALAWTVKNLARPLGYQRLGLPCQLMGTGMAFPWSCISNAAIAGSHLVEDLKLGLELTRARTAPLFCPEALVTSVFAANLEGARAQRTRWEHGHLAMALGAAPGLFLDALRSANLPLLALTLDLCVPPLALLALALSASAVLALIYRLTSGAAGPLLFALALIGLLTGAVLLAWARFGRNLIPLRILLLAPIYALAKLPLYV
ncbi:MAG: glycosyltransferase family 2 protein, partial [Steroidobacteraceae bacterium]